MKILAVDPGKHLHFYSSWDSGALVEYGKHKSGDMEFWMEFIAKHNVLYVEDQYLSRGVGVKAIIDLVRAAHELVTMAKILKVEHHYVNPKKWESHVLQVSSKARRGSIKALSKIVATAVAGKTIKDHNIADAINIGFAVVTGVFKNKQEGVLL